MRLTGGGKLIEAVARRDKRCARNFALFSSFAGYSSYPPRKPSSSTCRTFRVELTAKTALIDYSSLQK